ncbi:DUF2254 domain-containing protein [Bowmanella dokdonensis]|uniref:DUF2254 domain-containing protein n=1 Tax=Bowmanella dokdonensis TaxID=751969 RepID=A0A939DN78_9ALTE|nr:DUF2254 domain-containing protein [Bowmanella dokdonensis]MBN7825220.1 DUF2254 domain-containing protein [Bowmanella dokdonensis]
MVSRLGFWVNRTLERLWVKPLMMCVVSVLAVFAAKWLGDYELASYLPQISLESLESLLSIMSASMLVIATFCVGSMVSAYASASTSATPRSFSLVIADDVSQNALATFVGAFIFSIVAIVAVKNQYFGTGGNFLLFVFTLLVFALVILTFVRWVDRIARLGRINSTIEKIEQATNKSLQARRLSPLMGGTPVRQQSREGHPVFADSVGYVQRVELTRLQKLAEQDDLIIRLEALPGRFLSPGRKIASLYGALPSDPDLDAIRRAFVVGRNRTFDGDPRFGLVTLSQVASKALSPGINDTGTAIDVLSSLTRLLTDWSQPVAKEDVQPVRFDRVQVPELGIEEMFEDAFTLIARDGAGAVEVATKLQKTLYSLSTLPHDLMHQTTLTHAKLALKRSELVMQLDEDLDEVKKLASFATDPPSCSSDQNPLT